MIGGVFNNADILRLDYSVEYHAEKATEEPKDGYLLALKATDPASRLRPPQDVGRPRRRCCRPRSRPIAASGLLIKTLRFKDIKDFGGGIRRPATLETDSPLYKGYKSVMLYANIKTAHAAGRGVHAQLPVAGRRAA